MPPCLSLCQAVAEEKLSARERRLQGLEAEAESLRQQHQREILEYQEQVKQHARTIVELEERLVSAAQQAEEDQGVSRPRGQCSVRSLPRPPPLPPSAGPRQEGPPLVFLDFFRTETPCRWADLQAAPISLPFPRRTWAKGGQGASAFRPR